jgi:hypothetical protein
MSTNTKNGLSEVECPQIRGTAFQRSNAHKYRNVFYQAIVLNELKQQQKTAAVAATTVTGHNNTKLMWEFF